MNCKDHPEQAAVGSCTVCGSGMCTSCINGAITHYGKPVCSYCAPNVIKSELRHMKALNIKALIALIASGILMLLGLITCFYALIIGQTATTALGNLFVFFGLAGLPAMWSATAGSDTDKAVTRGLLASGNKNILGFLLFRLIFAFLLGIIVTPINFYKNYMIYKNTKAEIANINSL